MCVRICEIMILDGNYLFLDFEKVKGKLINAFCKFYGEEHRQEITDKINSVQYIGFHTYREAIDYYNQYLEKFKDEIVFEFFKILKKPYNEKIANEVFFNQENFTYNLINTAMEGGKEIDDSYSSAARESILDSRNILKESFSLSDENLYEELLELKKSLHKAIDIVEQKHDCDVFKDIRCVRSVKRDVFKKFLLGLSELGVNISLKDGMVVGSEYFDDSSIYDLDSFGIYFDDEFLGTGIINSFLQNEEELEKFEDKFRFYYDRLTYLEYAGVTFKYISEEFENLTEDYDGLELLKKEFDYQKSNFIELPTITCVDKKAWKKDWAKGNFIPRHIAESIEYIRNECQDELFFKSKNFEFYKKNKFELFDDYFTTFNFDIHNGMKPFYRVYINEDLNESDYVLSSLIHELNHVLGFYPYSYTEGLVECKEGISMVSFEYLNKFEEEKSRWEWSEDVEMVMFQENVNQALTKEVFDIFMKMYENPYKSDRDKIPAASEYEMYDFITEDFYKANKKLFMDNVMSKSPTSLYYDSVGYYQKCGPLGSLIRFIKNGIYKRQDENRNKYSVSDLKKIGALIGYFEKELLHFISVKQVTQEQIKNGEYKNILTRDESERLEYVLKERDRLNKLLVERKMEESKKESILEK